MLAPPQKEQEFPYWLVFLIGLGGWLFYQVWASDLYAKVMATVTPTPRDTVAITFA